MRKMEKRILPFALSTSARQRLLNASRDTGARAHARGIRGSRGARRANEEAGERESLSERRETRKEWEEVGREAAG